MADDPVLERRDNHTTLDAIRALRQDVREDVAGLRTDMREDNERLETRMVGMVTGFIVAHGAEHQAERTASNDAHARFDKFIKAAEYAEARRDGALGVFLFVLEHVSRHWRPITAILTAIATVILAATGNVQLQIVAR